MKNVYTYLFALVVLIMTNTSNLYAQNSWAMAIINNGQCKPVITEYRCLPEIGENGISYFRIYDANYVTQHHYYNPFKLQYGYRLGDKQIYIYDFETNEECLAFDFTLKEGDTFRTYNGIDWIVESTNDTLLNVSYKGLGDACRKRILCVRSKDGAYEDTWVEDFGSLSNHFMVLPMNQQQRAYTLWIESDWGCYLINEISSDPLYTKDFGYPDENTKEILIGATGCSYLDYELKVEYSQYRSVNRQYKCFYRKEDNFYYAFVWDLNPASEIAGETVIENGSFSLHGVPPLESGEYKFNFQYEDESNSEENDMPLIRGNYENAFLSKFSYDTSGRSLPFNVTKGIKLIDGKKVFVNH